MQQFQVVWLTERSQRHQQAALEAAPREFHVRMLHQPSTAELQENLGKADFLVSERQGKIDESLLAWAPRLKLIVRLGALIDDIDINAVVSRGIKLARQPVMGSMIVAEHCMMVMLALLKKLNEAQYRARTFASEQEPVRTDENTFRYNWAKITQVQGIYGKTISIVGMGDIGIELARRLRAFQPAGVYYFKRHPYSEAAEHELSIQHVATLGELLKMAEVLVVLLPYSHETEHLINAEALAKMPAGSLLIQAGSGSTIDEKALVKALQNGQLAGAALDTFEFEPLLADHPLRKLTEDPTAAIILTPHIAAATPPYAVRRSQDYAEIMRFVQGEPLHYEIS